MFKLDTLTFINSHSLCGMTTKVGRCTMAQVSTHWRIMGNPQGHPEHTEIPVVVSEDGQPAKLPHTDTASNMTEMEGSQPGDTLLQLLTVLQNRNNAVVIYKTKM